MAGADSQIRRRPLAPGLHGLPMAAPPSAPKTRPGNANTMRSTVSIPLVLDTVRYALELTCCLYSFCRKSFFVSRRHTICDVER